MNLKFLMTAGLALGLLSAPAAADKPAPAAVGKPSPAADKSAPAVLPETSTKSTKVDAFRSGTAAFNAGQFSRARELWTPLARDGDRRAQHALGRMYEKGNGVERDFTKAFDWYRQAAEQGHADSQYRLAVAYSFGLGVKQDDGTALSWLRKAAENDHKRAQKTLARAYEEGRLGLKADPKQAKYWYDKADSGS